MNSQQLSPSYIGHTMVPTDFQYNYVSNSLTDVAGGSLHVDFFMKVLLVMQEIA